MSNIELVQKLADGSTVRQVAKEQGYSERYFERKVVELRKSTLSRTTVQLIANYFRKGLIT